MFITKHKNDATDSPNARLMRAMRFGSKDLAANREGELSESQKRPMLRIYFWRMFLCAFWALGMGIGFFGAVIGIPVERRTTDLWIYMIGVVPFAVMGLCIHSYYQYRRQVLSSQVLSFTGLVRKYPHRFSHGHLIRVIDREDQIEHIYNVGYRACSAFLEEETYTIYSPAFDLQRVVAVEYVPTRGLIKENMYDDQTQK